MRKQFITLLSLLALAGIANARQPQRGYRGFLDWSNNLRTDQYMVGDGHYTTFYSGASTTHGYQITPLIFVGAGIDFQYCSKLKDSFFRAFIDGRTDLKFGVFTPFADARFGYNMTQNGGLYFSPSIGYRFNWGRKVGINVGIGLTLQAYKVDIVDYSYSPEGYFIVQKVGTSHRSESFFSFRVGFDF